MKNILPAICLLLSVTKAAHADNILYSILTVDTQLIKNANIIVRADELRYEINSTTETVTKTHVVFTILNEKASGYASFMEGYDKHTEIVSMEGVLYDAMGKELKKLKKKDAEDLSAVSGETLMSDNRVKRMNLYYKVYPYTVEFTSETRGKSTLFFPSWTAQADWGMAVEKSSITIVAPENYQIRYKAFNYSNAPVITQEKNQKLYSWNIARLKAVVNEPNAPRMHEITPMVIFGPTDFQMEDYKGNMSSWQDFGRFVYSLKQGRDVLPDNVKLKVHAIADGMVNRREKIARLYEYMQQNTRYIGVQLGIGGWQPFDAKYVASNGYGDCKALTNYMYSLLKEAGITSYYTLVRAGKFQQYITEDFPSQQFNHVILSIPMEKDTMWLECTSQTLPAGYLSSFTSDRPALLIDETGGKMIHTPVYGIKENFQRKKVIADLQDDGSLLVKASSNYSGLMQDGIHEMIHQLSKDKIKEELHEELDFATYDIVKFDYNEEKNSLPSINESLDINISSYATITGKRLFIVPNVMTRTKVRLTADTSRKYDVMLYEAYTDIDSVEIKIPAGYNTEAMPQPITIRSAFGNYNCSVQFSNDKLYYFRKLEVYNGRYPASSYNDLVKFYDSIYKADKTRVVLVKPGS